MARDNRKWGKIGGSDHFREARAAFQADARYATNTKKNTNGVIRVKIVSNDCRTCRHRRLFALAWEECKLREGRTNVCRPPQIRCVRNDPVL